VTSLISPVGFPGLGLQSCVVDYCWPFAAFTFQTASIMPEMACCLGGGGVCASKQSPDL
jgi:hypothetical protein